LIAVGAILYFAVHAHISGLAISTIGLNLMIVGIIGALISVFLPSRSRTVAADRPVMRDRGYY
jgi:hypothetical protein